MKSLTTLIHEAAADDPLARALEAMLDSGLIVWSRDTEGRFVHLSGLLTERAGIIAGSGDSQPRNLRVFDETGRLLPGSEYPASITRMTGSSQHVLHRLVSDDDRDIWLQMSTMPLERGAEGWSVLTVATDVTDLRHTLGEAQDDVAARGVLLELSVQLMTQPADEDALRETFSEVLAQIVPDTNVSLALRDGEEFHTIPLVHGYGPSLEPRRGRYATEQRERWTSTHAHVNRDVQDTDIYGANVVVELTNVVRSIVVAPCLEHDGTRIGSITVTSDQPGAFTDGQVESLEFAARLFANAPRLPETLAEAS